MVGTPLVLNSMGSSIYLMVGTPLLDEVWEYAINGLLFLKTLYVLNFYVIFELICGFDASLCKTSGYH